jgi:FG-GAP repeat
VTISGDTVVVGAPGDLGSRKIEPRKDQGAAYVFARSGESWNQLRNLTADDGALGDKFGVSVAISGNTVVVGAHYNNKRQGSAYAFSQR